MVLSSSSSSGQTDRQVYPWGGTLALENGAARALANERQQRLTRGTPYPTDGETTRAALPEGLRDHRSALPLG